MTDKTIDNPICPVCNLNAKETCDPYTQSRICAGYNSGQQTPCGKTIIQWIHFGCAQQGYLRD